MVPYFVTHTLFTKYEIMVPYFITHALFTQYENNGALFYYSYSVYSV